MEPVDARCGAGIGAEWTKCAKWKLAAKLYNMRKALVRRSGAVAQSAGSILDDAEAAMQKDIEVGDYMLAVSAVPKPRPDDGPGADEAAESGTPGRDDSPGHDTPDSDPVQSAESRPSR